MASVNKVILIGNMGADPEMRYMPNGDAVANLRIATSESWKDKNTGEKKELTEWHRVVMYRKLADIAGQYLKKGYPVYIEGKLVTRKWQDKDGQDRYTTEIVADEMKMLGSRREGDDNPTQEQQQNREAAGERAVQSGTPQSSQRGAFDGIGDDIPF